jgi:hypothetical protein
MPSKSVAVEAAAEIPAVTLDKSSGQERGGEDGGSSSAIQAQMAADIAELRTIMMAAVKHFKIEMPRPESEPLTSQTTIDFGSIKPTDERYDEEVTVSRHFALLPTEDTLLSISSWDKWPLDRPSWERVKVVFQSQSWQDLPEGL